MLSVLIKSGDLGCEKSVVEILHIFLMEGSSFT